MDREIKRRLTPPIVIRPRTFALAGLLVVAILILPWSMYSTGAGRITALDPSERVQEITAPVNGFVAKWYVREGSRVKQGDLLFDLVDNDPALLERMKLELQAAETAVDEAKLAYETAQLNADRQNKLFREGLSARKEFEKAKIEVAKLSIELSKAQAVLVKAQTQVSRQTSQHVTAPRDGSVLRVMHGEGNYLVKSGDVLIVFAPDLKSIAIETWHAGNDLRFLQVGQIARVQFEGWPSVQIPGWPSVAINTFRGRVKLIDYASSSNGRFRVLIAPDEPWPSDNFLKLNANARSTIWIGETHVGIEIWRKLNDFPPATGPLRDELRDLMMKKKKPGLEDADSKGSADSKKADSSATAESK